MKNNSYIKKLIKIIKLRKCSEKRDNQKKSKTEPSFLVKLFNILNESQYKSYIQWGPDDQTVIISDSNGLTKKVLPKFYNHNNYASFVRQLNMIISTKFAPTKKTEKKNIFTVNLKSPKVPKRSNPFIEK